MLTAAAHIECLLMLDIEDIWIPSFNPHISMRWIGLWCTGKKLRFREVKKSAEVCLTCGSQG